MSKFIIGIGSQRAGSTLLSRILEQCTPIFTHPVKELHYYDTLYGVRNEAVLKDFSRKQLERLEQQGFEPSTKREECLLRTNKILYNRSIENVSYIDLFRPCIMDNEYLCEITPEYMILPEAGVIKMSEDIGSSSKIILMIREPVDRFISAVKLLKSYGINEYNPETFETDLIETLETMPAWIDQQLELSDYKRSINLYKKYFDQVLVLQYEKLLSDPMSIKQDLESFLDLSIDDEKYLEVTARKVNNLGKTAKLSEQTMERLIALNKKNIMSYELLIS